MKRVIGALMGVLLGVTGSAQAAPEDARSVIACETLVALRLLMGHDGGDHAVALTRLPRHPACLLLTRERVGAPEQRAMIGGAPFECFTVPDEGRCLWMMP